MGMAMTPTLYTISALSTELGRDRRTIAEALRHDRPDGKLGTYDAWYLTTALKALSNKQLRGVQATARSAFVEIMLHRLDMKVSQRSDLEFTLDEFAKIVGVERETVLIWIRVGMPYAFQGNWRTGEGFSIRMHHAIEWLGLAGAHVDERNDKAALVCAPSFIRQ
jgi:hypothetical protein